MSKEKKVRQIVLDKLYYKNQPILKKSTRSNAPTQSTPNQPKQSFKFVQKFFQNFQAQCAIIYQPVKLELSKPLKRILENELMLLQKIDKKLKFKTQSQDLIIQIRGTNQKKQFQLSTNMKKQQMKFIKKKSYGNSRLNTQNAYSRSRNKLRQNTIYLQNRNSKNKSSILNVISPDYSKILSKQNSLQFTSRVTSPSFKVQRERPLKSRLNNQKQYDKQKYRSCNKKQNQTNPKKPHQFNSQKSHQFNSQKSHQSNSQKSHQFNSQKSHQSNSQKYCAPKKNINKQQIVYQQRIIRIQSLRNLNQNGVRKYYYRKDY